MTLIFPKSIVDFRYLYRTYNIYIILPIYISDVRNLYLASDIQYPSWLGRRARVRAGAGISGVGYIYWTYDIGIGRPI